MEVRLGMPFDTAPAAAQRKLNAQVSKTRADAPKLELNNPPDPSIGKRCDKHFETFRARMSCPQRMTA